MVETRLVFGWVLATGGDIQAVTQDGERNLEALTSEGWALRTAYPLSGPEPGGAFKYPILLHLERDQTSRLDAESTVLEKRLRQIEEGQPRANP